MCGECRALLVEARQRRAFLAGQEGRQWYRHFRLAHWNPRYYVGGFMPGNDGPDQLQAAMRDLIFGVAEDVRDERCAQLQRDSPPMLDRLQADSRHDHTESVVLVTPSVRTAINTLHLVLAQLLPRVYQAGVDHGKSLLFQLASGEITPGDFDRNQK